MPLVEIKLHGCIEIKFEDIYVSNKLLISQQNNTVLVDQRDV